MITNMVNSMVYNINLNRDNLIIIYGKKNTGKQNLRDIILTLVFRYLEKVLIEGAVEDLDLRLSTCQLDEDGRDVFLKREGYRGQLLKLLGTMVGGEDSRKEEPEFERGEDSGKNKYRQARVRSTKCSFLELSRVCRGGQGKGEEFMSKVSGVYVITSNRVLGDHSVSVSKDHFVGQIIGDALGESRGAGEREALRKLGREYGGLSTDVVCTVGADSEVSFESYQMIGGLPLGKMGGGEGV